MDYKRWLPIEFGYSTVCYSYTHCFFVSSNHCWIKTFP
jgi:hypothetical protein